MVGLYRTRRRPTALAPRPLLCGALAIILFATLGSFRRSPSSSSSFSSFNFLVHAQVQDEQANDQTSFQVVRAEDQDLVAFLIAQTEQDVRVDPLQDDDQNIFKQFLSTSKKPATDAVLRLNRRPQRQTQRIENETSLPEEENHQTDAEEFRALLDDMDVLISSPFAQAIENNESPLLVSPSPLSEQQQQQQDQQQQPQQQKDLKATAPIAQNDQGGRMSINNQNIFYVSLSAPPGTPEAIEQHRIILEALKNLPGGVTIRQEFGADEDDVLNVISFKMDGSTTEGLEQVAAMEGVVGIYPVRTRRRSGSVPMKPSLRRTRPSLNSAHILTGTDLVHAALGLTGKGIKVGIIDTGVDYKHPALGGCFGQGCKVAFGYDFVGDQYESEDDNGGVRKEDPDPYDCGGHGTHVAGIVAANNVGPQALGGFEFVGVAPEVTLGAYRVFGCDGEVSDDVLLAALKRAYKDGMDIVNLSLGGSSSWPEEPFALACSGYIKKGLHISIANGNDGEEGLFEDGSPATAVGAFAVGSVDNLDFLGLGATLGWKRAVAGSAKSKSKSSTLAFVDIPQGDVVATDAIKPISIGMVMASDDKDVSMAAFNSDLTYVIKTPTSDALGCADYNTNDYTASGLIPSRSIVLLVRRGNCTFTQKAQAVIKAGFGGLLVYDTVPEQRPLGMAVQGLNISVAGLSFEDATLIVNALSTPPTGSANKQPASTGQDFLTAKFERGDKILKMASGGKISDFSSWGPDARLRYKPDIVTPGGMIYSTFPLAKGAFTTLQGTSMASPYMAGIQALYLSHFGKTIAPDRLLNIVQNTAVTTLLPGSGDQDITSVFQQGAGLVSMTRLFNLEPTTVLTPPSLFLNDTLYQKLTHDVVVYNPSKSQTRTWRIQHRPAVSVNGFDGAHQRYLRPVNQTRIQTSKEAAKSVIMNPSVLSLAPGESKTVQITIQPPSNLNIKEDWLFSGYIDFLCYIDKNTRCQSSMLSYGGMHGHLANVPILNPDISYPAIRLGRDQALFESQKNSNRKSIHGDEQDDKSVSDNNNKKNKKQKKNAVQKEVLYRDRNQAITIGKDDNDWIQVLVSVNFPTGLLTIEVETVCDGDQDARGSASATDKDRIQLHVVSGDRDPEEEITSGLNRFSIPVDENELGVDESTDSENTTNNDGTLNLAVRRKRQKIKSQELAFMPGGLLQPYKEYSNLMLAEQEVEAAEEAEKEQAPNASEATRASMPMKFVATKGRNCVPRILGLIPSGYNPWSTRTDSTEDNAIQEFGWMGDLLIANPGVSMMGLGFHDPKPVQIYEDNDATRETLASKIGKFPKNQQQLDGGVQAQKKRKRALGQSQRGKRLSRKMFFGRPDNNSGDQLQGLHVSQAKSRKSRRVQKQQAKKQRAVDHSHHHQDTIKIENNKANQGQHHHHQAESVHHAQKGKGENRHQQHSRDQHEHKVKYGRGQGKVQDKHKGKRKGTGKGKGKGKGHGHHDDGGKHHGHDHHHKGDGTDGEGQSRNRNSHHHASGGMGPQSKALPDGKYRLVVKVLKPWGVRGRAQDVERWSSPIIVIKRK